MFKNEGGVACLSSIGKALEPQKELNPMVRRWRTTVNGMRNDMPHGAFYIAMSDEFSDASRILFNEAVDFVYQSQAPDIVCHIDSYGGNVYALLPMLDKLESVRKTPKNPAGKKIITVCRGHVMSCGAVLWAAGDERYMLGEMSEVMIHPVSVSMAGRTAYPQLATEAQQMERLNNDLFDYMSDRFGIDVNKWLRDKGHGCELHIRPYVAADPEAAWDGADFWLKDATKAPIGLLAYGDAVPQLDFQFMISCNMNVTPPARATLTLQEVPPAAAAMPRGRARMPGVEMHDRDIVDMVSTIRKPLAWNPADIM
jgi:ATP-dependent protease ClpP protease subunit